MTDALTHQEQATNAINWIEKLFTAVEDGIKQRKKSLGDLKDGFCCLGYACYLSEIDYIVSAASSQELTGVVGLHDSLGRNKNYPPYLSALFQLNDTENYTFPQIAQALKDNAEAYFIPEVAELINEHFNKREVAA